MSAGQAALKGTWTVIGPDVQCMIVSDVQCMIVSKHAHLIQDAVEKSRKIPLVKKRGVYWLPVSGCKSQHAGSPAEPIAAHPVGGAARQAQAGSPAERGCLGGPTSQMIAAAKVVKKAIPAGQDCGRMMRQRRLSIQRMDMETQSLRMSPENFQPWVNHRLKFQKSQDPPKPRRSQIQFQRPNMTATC